MEASGSMEALAVALKTDRTIKIYVNGDQVPYLVSQQALSSASIYFVKAIKNEHMGENNVGVLRFPADGSRGWKVLLFWITQKTLPSKEEFPGYVDGPEYIEDILVESWILADKYLMPKLQNAIMKMLLEELDRATICFDVAVKAIREHTTSSVLGRLMCESLVESTYGGAFPLTKPEALSELDGVAGAIVSLGAALQSFNEQSLSSIKVEGVKVWPSRMRSDIWKEFMVDE